MYGNATLEIKDVSQGSNKTRDRTLGTPRMNADRIYIHYVSVLWIFVRTEIKAKIGVRCKHRQLN